LNAANGKVSILAGAGDVALILVVFLSCEHG